MVIILCRKAANTYSVSVRSSVLHSTYCKEHDGLDDNDNDDEVHPHLCVCKLHNCILPSEQMAFNANYFDTSAMKCCVEERARERDFIAIICCLLLSVSMTANHNFCYWRGKWPVVQVTNVTSFSLLIIKWVCCACVWRCECECVWHSAPTITVADLRW